MITDEVLRCLGPIGIEAAATAFRMHHDVQDDRIKQKSLAVEQARYEVTRAQRQYDSVDAANRLVAAELERRWNAALKVQAELEEELESVRKALPKGLSAEQERKLLALGSDLRRLWDHPQSPPEFKKRVLRVVLQETVVTANENQIQLRIHWRGGDHTELSFEKVGPGQHRFVTDRNIVELAAALARLQPDGMIASILNRNGYRTPHGERWTARSICSLRNRHQIKVYLSGEWRDRQERTVEESAALLRVSETRVLKWIRSGELPATQLCPHAPWVIKQTDVEHFTPRRRTDAGCAENTTQLDLNLQ